MLFQVKSLVALALVAVAVPVGLSSMSASSTTTSAASAVTPDLVLRGALARAGLGSAELAVAGFNAQGATQLIARAQLSEVVQQNQLAPADEALANARVALAAIEEAVRGGDGSPASLQELADARTAVANAEAVRDGLIGAVFTAATSGVAQGATQTLAQVQSNKRWKTLPLEFLVAERTQVEWNALKEALTHERVCTKLGKPTNPTITASLAAFRAEQGVSAALSLLEANRTSIEAAWNTATGVQ
ncbi:MAG: hypothetical protein R3F49_05790 [Planctomycetota bacterium]